MTFPIIKRNFIIVPNDQTITVELEFKTMLLCTYNVTIKEENSNKAELDEIGDNTNDQDDKFCVGIAHQSVGKKIWAAVKVFDIDIDNKEYEVKLVFKQDDIVIAEGELTTEKKIIKAKEHMHEWYFIVKIIDHHQE